MRDFESERQRLFTRRTLILGGGQALIFGGLVARMYYLQVTEGARYATLAEENRIRTKLLSPPRGLIYDRFGERLAVNEQNFRLLLVPEQAGSVDQMLEKISAFITLTEYDLKKIKRELKRSRAFNPITIAENLTWEQTAAIQVRLPELDGVSIDVGQIRHYPYPVSTAHVLGYVAAVSERDLKSDSDPLLTVPGLQIGKSGIEKIHDKELRGTVGTANLEVNAFGRVIREVQRREGLPGKSLSLTIDLELQKYVQQRLMTERSASCVVMDVHTGAIYALASHPSFDNNAFSKGISQKLWDDLRNDETAPLSNKVIAGLYSPGSTFKMVTALAALETGHITTSHSVTCYGVFKLGTHRFHCWKHYGHGKMDLASALRESCDVYFYDLASRIGIDAIEAMARKLGLGSITNLDIPGEAEGLVPSREWKEARRGERWQGGDTLNTSIGQGFVLSTPLQLAVMTARLVNGGKAVEPRLTKAIEGEDLPVPNWEDLGFNPDHVSTIISGMNSVCNNRKGTAYSARIAEEGKEMGGKTGTAQVRRISLAERAAGIVRNEDREWRLRDNALFVGYAPIHSPRYAVSVIVDHGGGGSAVAAPIARDILIEAQRLNPTDSRTRPNIPPAELIERKK